MKMELGLKTLLLSLSLCLGSFAKTLKVDTVTPSVADGDFTIQRNGTGGVVLGDYSGVLKASTGTVSAGTVDLASEVNGILGIANGGTGSSTQNFVDLSTDQTVGGSKTFSLPIVLDEQSSTPATPSSGFKKFYAKDDGKLYSLDSTGSEVEVGAGAGSGGINYIANFGIETNADGYTAYADAAATDPVDGTGGTPNVTVARNTTTPLRGDGDLLFTKDAANRQGEGFSYDFTIDVADQAKKLTISFDYSTSANYADDDMGVYIYDVTNASVVRVNGELLKAGDGTHYAQFQTAPDSTSYRLIGHVRTTNANLYTVSLDNIKVGPTNLAFGVIQTDWEDYTPTITGFGTVSISDAKYRRVGDTLHLNIRGTTGTPTAVELQIGLPDSKAVSSEYSGVIVAGNAHRGATTEAHYPVIATPGDTFLNIGFRNAGTIALLTPQQGTTWGAGEYFTINAEVKIQGWSSNAKMSEDLGGREIVVRGAGNGGESITANVTDIPFTEVEDTTASWDGDSFTAPETGHYQVDGSIDISGSSSAIISIYKNATQEKTIGLTQSAAGLVPFSGSIRLLAGDVISLRSSAGITLQSSTIAHNIHIQKLASPQTILETETVAARYTSDSGQAIGTSATTLIYEDIAGGDSHGAYNTSTGEYTVPTSGWYTVNASYEKTPASTTTFALVSINVNGTIVSENYNRHPSTADAYVTSVSDEIILSKGDVVKITGQTSAASNMSSTSRRNFFSIARTK